MVPFILGLAISAVKPQSPTPIDSGLWIRAEDYPRDALRNRATGIVRFELDVNSSGKVAACRVIASSGTPSLDGTTCDLLKARAHFTPAMDDLNHRPVASTYTRSVRWVLPTPIAISAVPAGIASLVPLNMGVPRFASRSRLFPPAFPLHPTFAPDSALSPETAEPITGDSPAPDPSVLFGQLANGLRYAIMRNVQPLGSVSMRLRIGAGSVDETDDERGYAHFLEHMAFRGSTNVPDGQFAKSLEQIGLTLGADTTANTTQEDTIYGLDFPPSNMSSVTTGLFLLREVADRITIAPGAVASERGVILAEERLRDNPGLHAEQARLAFLLAGQRIPTRPPIGTVAGITGATSAGLRAFYLAHYRPQNAILVVTGDIRPKEVEAQIRTGFADWSNRPTAAPPADRGPIMQRSEQVKLFVEPGSPEMLQVAWVAPFTPSPDSFAREQMDLAANIAVAVLNDRLYRIAQAAGSPFTAAAADREELFGSAKSVSIALSPKSGGFDRALAAAIAEQRRLATYGISQDELQRAITRIKVGLAQGVASTSTRSTSDLATNLLASIVNRVTYTTPAQTSADFDYLIGRLKLEDINRAATALFAGSGPLVFGSDGKLPIGGETALRRALLAADHQSIAAGAASAARPWPYTSFGSPSRIVDRKDVADLGVSVIRFANGATLTVKSVPQPKDDILVDLTFGQGLSGLPAGLERSYWMVSATQAFIQGGLAKASTADIADQFAGKAFAAQFSADEERFHLHGHTRDDDLDAQLQLLTAYLADPGFRSVAVVQAQSAEASILPQFDTSATFTAGRDLAVRLHDGDKRWSLAPGAADLAKGTAADLPELLKSALAAPINLVIVGDMSVDKAIAAAQATIGALPARKPQPTPITPRFPAATAQPLIQSVHCRPDQGVAIAAWPTTGFFASTADARAMEVLANLIQGRMTDELRQADGLTYAPDVFTDNSEVYPKYGLLAAQVELPPARFDMFYSALKRIIADLATTPVSTEELGRAVTPLLDKSKARLYTTEYWVGALTRADEDSRVFDFIRSRVSELAAVNPATIQRLTRTYLLNTPVDMIIRNDARLPSISQQPSIKHRTSEIR